VHHDSLHVRNLRPLRPIEDASFATFCSDMSDNRVNYMNLLRTPTRTNFVNIQSSFYLNKLFSMAE